LQNGEDLTKPITKTELLWVIKQMATGKTPGPDGIAIEFYRKCWHIIGDDFTQVLERNTRKRNNPRRNQKWNNNLRP